MTLAITERAGLPPAAPLSRRYDLSVLTHEVQALRGGRWRAQRAFSHDGVAPESEIDWRILPLRSIGGDPERTDPGGAGLEGFADTPFLIRSPYLRSVLNDIPAPLRAVRLMALGPNVKVHEHRDGKCGFPWGALRLHIPVITNPAAHIVIGGQTYHWDAGRLWFGDFDRLHYVRNNGLEPRVHVVVDTMVTQAVLDLFPDDYRDRLPWHDVLLASDPVPLRAADLAAFSCNVSVPADFPEWSDDEVGVRRSDLSASISQHDDRLVLSIDGQPRFALVHIGGAEFRFEGWTDERTLHIELAPPEPRVRFRVRVGHAITEQIRPASPRQA